MKKWISIISVCLSLVAVAVVAVSVFPAAQLLLSEDEHEPIVVSNVNILSKLRQTATEKEELQYLVLGDSVARGLGSGDRAPHGYSSLVVKGLGEEERIPLELHNHGVSGQTSQRLLDSLSQEEIRSQVAEADLISLTIGGNDLLKEALQSNPLQVLSEFERIQNVYNHNLDQILKEIRALNSDAPVLLTSLYNPISPSEPYYGLSNKLLRQWNAGMKKTAYHHPLTHVVDVDNRLRSAQGEWLHDEIHPNEKGYRLIAEGILEDIRNQAQSSASNR